MNYIYITSVGKLFSIDSDWTIYEIKGDNKPDLSPLMTSKDYRLQRILVNGKTYYHLIIYSVKSKLTLSKLDENIPIILEF
ncbi:TPA: hypothetical protein ACJHID_002478, partial [Staphylococcus pseudintermedius]